MPRAAPRPDATRSATGVANPSAHGQAITNTVIAIEIDFVSVEPVKYQPAKVPIASTVTIGTKTALMRSAKRWIGAFVP